MATPFISIRTAQSRKETRKPEGAGDLPTKVLKLSVLMVMATALLAQSWVRLVGVLKRVLLDLAHGPVSPTHLR